MSQNPHQEFFQNIYDELFRFAEFVYTKTGTFRHQILGIFLKDGKFETTTSLLIEDPDTVPEALAMMTQRFPITAHMFEAWVAETEGDLEENKKIIPSQHPNKKDAIVMMIYAKDMIATANCIVDPKRKTITKAELAFPREIGGRMMSPSHQNTGKLN